MDKPGASRGSTTHESESEKGPKKLALDDDQAFILCVNMVSHACRPPRHHAASAVASTVLAHERPPV